MSKSPSWNDVLADSSEIKDRINKVFAENATEDLAVYAQALTAAAIINQTDALARIGEELQRISFHTIASPDYT